MSILFSFLSYKLYAVSPRIEFPTHVVLLLFFLAGACSKNVPDTAVLYMTRFLSYLDFILHSIRACVNVFECACVCVRVFAFFGVSDKGCCRCRGQARRRGAVLNAAS